MRRHAKASFAQKFGETGSAGSRRAMFACFCLAALALVALLDSGSVSPARADTACPNAALAAQSNTNPTTGQPYSAGLSECRAYEMVSPPEKQTQNIYGVSGTLTENSAQIPVSPDGTVVGFASPGAILPLDDYFSTGYLPYLAKRTAGGWTTSYAQSPATLTQSNVSGTVAIPDSTPDFGTAASCLPSAKDETVFTCAVQRGVGQPWTVVSEYRVLNGRAQDVYNTHYIGGSKDLSHVYFQSSTATGRFLSSDALQSDSNPGQGSVYEIAGFGTASPTLKLVTVDSNGNPIGEPGNSSDPYNEKPFLQGLGAGARGSGIYGFDQYQAISEDGSTVYFTAWPGSGPVHIYARRNSSTTVDISSPSPAECTTCDPTTRAGIYQGASADGEKVFFLTTQQLVDADTDSLQDLYEYDFSRGAGHHLVQVSGGDIGDLTPGSGAEVLGVVRTTPEGTGVYFTAKGVLTTPPNSVGQSAVSGAANLYYFDTGSGRTKYVGTLAGGDSPLWGVGNNSRQAQATPDGRYLIFATTASLIGSGPMADSDNASDVYRYDSETGELVRISVGESDFPASSNGNTAGMNAVLAPLILGSNSQTSGAEGGIENWSRQISADGSHVVFSTPEALQADDVNTGASPACGAEQPNTQGPTGCDVYMWHDGTVSLVSDGQDPAGTRAQPTMSSSGSEVFFMTTTRLVGQDQDTLRDLYVARIGGGFPYAAPAPGCAEESTCHGPVAVPPATVPAASATFAGPGNEAIPKRKKKHSKKHKKPAKHNKSGKHKKSAKKNDHKRSATQKRG